MIWLASYPRSGNTFIRNILYHSYNIESEVFNNWSYRKPKPSDKVVKTHLLPHQLVPSTLKVPAVYLIRDGRDVVVSMAYQRSELVKPGSNFEKNLREIIIAQKGSYFGGWSLNVRHWLKRTNLIILFENLIKDPIPEIEKFRKVMDLPEPDTSSIPTFESQKYGKPKYGMVSNHSKYTKKEFSKLFFRKGKIGDWKSAMSNEMQDLFWKYHGETMRLLGYNQDGSINQVDISSLRKVVGDLDNFNFHVKRFSSTISFYAKAAILKRKGTRKQMKKLMKKSRK